MFDQLTSVKMGDYFYIETAGRHLKYQVTDIRVVLPHETESLNKVEGKDLATLITCTPYGVNTHRLLVTGERVPMDEEAVAAEAAQVKGAVMKPWMIAVLASVVVILGIAGVIWLRSRKRKGEEPQVLEAGVGAGALAPADSGDEAGAESGAAAEPRAHASTDPAAAEPASGASGAAAAGPALAGPAPAGAADAGAAPATPDLLASAEQISEAEIDAGRTAALKKLLEERGKQ